MSRSLWLSLAVVVCAAFAVGCEAECQDRFDCESGEVCTDGQCVPAAEDAGIVPDAGGLEDGGIDTDAGQPDAAQIDGGPTDGGEGDGGVSDGGNGTGDGGLSCSPASPTCAGPHRCEVSGAGGTCVPLWIGVTQQAGGALEQAVLVPFDGTGAGARILLGTPPSYWPRFSPDGTAVAYLDDPGPAGLGPIELVRRSFDGGTVQWVTSTDAGISAFAQLEWEPGPVPVWTRVVSNVTSGVQHVNPDGGPPVIAVTAGGFPDWWPDGSAIAFASAGIKGYAVGTGDVSTFTTGADDRQPLVSPSGKWIVYLRKDLGDTEEVTESLYVIDSTVGGATPIEIVRSTPAVGTAADGGAPGTFVSYPSWSHTDLGLVYVHVTYYRDAQGAVTSCDGIAPICAGAQGQTIRLQTLSAAGAPVGSPLTLRDGTHPSMSPDGRYLAYIVGGSVGSELRVVGWELDGGTFSVVDEHVHAFPTGLVTGTEEHRPRWQPK